MNATAPSSTTPESAKASADPIDQISFQKIFDGLSQYGITLNDAEQKRLEEIIREEVRKQNGGALAGMNIGALIPNIARILFAFIQELFGGAKGSKEFSLDNATTIISDAFSGATNTGKQGVYDEISVNIHDKLYAEGGRIREVADLVSGVSPYGNARDIGRGSAVGVQLASAANVPAGTASSLNPLTDVADASAGNGLPPSARGALTPRAVGA